MRTLPALKVSIFLALGICIGRWIVLPELPLFVITALLLLASILLDRFPPVSFILPLMLAAGGALLCRTSDPPEPPQPIAVTLTGRIEEPPRHLKDRLTFPLSVEELANGENRFKGHYRVWVRANSVQGDWKSGEKVTATGLLAPCPAPRNPGDFDLKRWRLINGYIGELWTTGVDLRTFPGSSFPPAYALRNWIIDRVDRFGKDEGALINALLLGFRRDLDPGLIQDLQLTGLTHLIALSGLNIGFLVGIFIGIGAVFRLRPSARAGLSILFVIIFMLLVPSRGSSLRAAIMAIALLSGIMLKRWSPALNSLGLAAVLICLYRPGDLFDAGFQLSFGAIGGIIIFGGRIDAAQLKIQLKTGRFQRLTYHWLIYPFLISLAATAFVLPLTSHHFSLMALATPVFNLVAIPLLWFIFAGSWLVLGLSLIWKAAAELAATGLLGSIAFWKWITHVFAAVSPTLDHRFSPIAVGILLALAVWTSRPGGRLGFKASISLLAFLILIVSDGFIRNRTLQIWFLDVGHGDAALWLMPDGRTAVIDGGPPTQIGRTGVVPGSLRALGRHRIDLMVASHPEADHIGGLIELVKQMPVENAISSPKQSESDTFIKLMEVSRKKGLSWSNLTRGSEIAGLQQDLRLRVLGPPTDAQDWTANDASLALWLQYSPNGKDTLGLLTAGDMERLGEWELIDRNPVRADLLKVSHHGSPTSSGEAFLNVVSPRMAVISQAGMGELSRFRSPKEVLERLERRGVEIHQTADEGAILIEPKSVDNRYRWTSIPWHDRSFYKWLFNLY